MWNGCTLTVAFKSQHKEKTLSSSPDLKVLAEKAKRDEEAVC